MGLLSGAVSLSEGAYMSVSAGSVEMMIEAVLDHLDPSQARVREYLELALNRQMGYLKMEDWTPAELSSFAVAGDLALRTAAMSRTAPWTSSFRDLLASIRDDDRIAGPDSQMAQGIECVVEWPDSVAVRGYLSSPSWRDPERWLLRAGFPHAIVPRSLWQAIDFPRVTSRHPGTRVRIQFQAGEGVVAPQVAAIMLDDLVSRFAWPRVAVVHVWTASERNQSANRADRVADPMLPGPDFDLVQGADAGLLYWRMFLTRPLPASIHEVVSRVESQEGGTWIQLTDEPPNEARYAAFRVVRNEVEALLRSG